MQSLKEKLEYAGSKSVSSRLARASWPVYDDYEAERHKEDVFICAPRRLPSSEPPRIGNRPLDDLGKRFYAPLRDYPDLVLRFAAIWRRAPLTQDEMLEVVLAWARNYGVLGLEGIDYLKAEGYSEHRMGRRESVSAFAREVREAARVLDLYEAATAPRDPGKQLTDSFQRWGWPTENISLDELRESALLFVGDRVGAYVRNECYPILWRTINKENDQTLGFAQSLSFHSLLGAMYLQMMWLLIEGSSARRCLRPGCPRIVSFEPPQPPDAAARRGSRGKYRTRKDKLYCSGACKQWVYDQTKKQRS